MPKKLTYTITHNATTTTVTPLEGDNVVFTKSRNGSDAEPYLRQVYRTEIESSLTFKGDDYTLLKGIEESDPCATVTLTVNCNGSTFFTGFLKLIEGEYDKDNHRLILDVEPSDEYTCLFDSLENEVNILEGTAKTTINFKIGEYEQQTCSQNGVTAVYNVNNPPTVNSCLANPTQGWTVLTNTITNITYNFGTNQIMGDVTTIWIRETVTSIIPPIGSNWVNIGGNDWVRPPYLNFDSTNSITWFPTSTGTTWITAYTVADAEYDFIDNGVSLSEVLRELLDENGCPLTVVSNFFDINPDGLNVPVNAPYAETKQHNLFIYQKSDIKRPNVSGNASRGLLKLEEILQWLYIQFNVGFVVDGANLRIEHITYFKDNLSPSLDLTLAQYSKWLRQKQKYKYKVSEVPRNINFRWMETNRFLFEGYPIQYAARCSTKDTSKDELVLTRVSNDLSDILTNPERYDDDGFVFVVGVEFNGEFYTDYEQSEVISGEHLNAFMSFPNLQNRFWRHDSYLLSGNLNNNAVTFDSTKPLRELDPVFIDGQCCDDFTNLDPSGIITHPCGDAELEKLTFSVRKGGFTVESVF